MTVAAFQDSCAGCHGDEISGWNKRVGEAGIAVVGVPDVDVETLREAGEQPGSWPPPGEEDLPLFTAAWLLSDPRGLQITASLETVEIWDLRDQPRAVLEDANALVWRFKEGLAETSSSDVRRLFDPLSAAVGSGEGDTHEKPLLAAALPHAVFSEAVRAWFPSLQEEVDAHSRGLEWEPAEENAHSDAPRTGGPPLTSRNPSVREPEDRGGAEDLLIDDLLVEDDLMGDDLLDEGRDEGEASEASPATDAERWNHYGGWYRAGNTLRYRPTAHADPWLVGWIQRSREGKGPYDTQLFRLLTEEGAPGRCESCHRFEEANAQSPLRWSPGPLPALAQQTRFDHARHIAVGTGIDCEDCHRSLQLDGDSDPFDPDFQAVERSNCMECHGQTVSSNCSTCHPYHAAPRGTSETEHTSNATIRGPKSLPMHTPEGATRLGSIRPFDGQGPELGNQDEPGVR